MTALKLTRCEAPIGAEIAGIDLNDPVPPALATALRQALADHRVLIFRAQRLKARPYARFVAAVYGPLVRHVLDQYHHGDIAEISVISNVVESGKGRTTREPAGAYWHSDLSYMAGPSDATFLYGREIPSSGGDTIFADLARAYQALPPELKRRIADLRARHHMFGGRRGEDAKVKLTPEQAERIPEVEHPVVRRHPLTGEPVLFVNPGFTRALVGLAPEASEELLETLYRHALDPAFQYRHRWRVGDVVGCDNRATMHSATGGYSEPRTLFRAIVGCGAPVLAAAA
jgi:taurine dioxygenase